MKHIRNLALLWIAGALAVATGAVADETGSIKVEQPWARATILKSRPAVTYLTLSNTGTEPDRLTGVTTPVAGHVSIHATEMADGVMKMTSLSSLEVEPGTRVRFRPGGKHLMLTDLRQSLREGSRFAVTLRFEKAGDIEVMVPVLAAGAKGPD